MQPLPNPFDVLGIPARFDFDSKEAEARHRDLSRALHPDRYAASGAGERREALERAVQVNEAWRVVRDPVRRAEALFALRGVPIGEAHEPKSSPAFLMDMLEQREALEEAKRAKKLEAVQTLAAGIEARVKVVERALGEGFAGERDVALAPLVPHLGELRFYRRFLDEVREAEEAIDEAAG